MTASVDLTVARAPERALETVVAALARRASLHPSRAALIAGGKRVSYGELWQNASAAAHELGRRGVKRGDRVLLAAPSVPAFAYGYFATHLLGAVAVPLDPHAPPARRDELMRRAAPSLAFGAHAESAAATGAVHAIGELDGLAPREIAFRPPVLEELADLIFTTGTTGRPKGVRLTQRNVASAARQINAVIGNTEGDVEVVPLPLYHSFGLGRLRCNIIAGGTVVLVDGFRLPGEIFGALKAHRATGLAGVPAGFAVLLRFGARGLGAFADQLRYIEIGSASMPLEHKQRLMDLLPATKLWMHYGLTEASRSAFIEFHRDRARLHSIGRAAVDANFSVRSDEGRPCPPGEPGQLWISGPHVSPGYWQDAELTARTFADGWVCTGDVGHVDAQGFLFLHGRKDDMINVGGFNVSPDEVERVLCEHPAIHEAGCIGVADPRNVCGQIVCAYVVAAAGYGKLSDEELSRWAAARLEPYKVPVQYTWLEALPRTASGKLLRAELRSGAAAAQ